MKLGPHILTLTSPAATWAGCAPIVKAVDYPAALTLARPDAITIFRAYVDNERQNTITPGEFLDLTLFRLAGFRPSYIEGLNEHKQKVSTGLLDYIEWTRQFTELAHSAGYKVAGFGFSTGNPEKEDWFALRDAGFAAVDALSIHEYFGLEGFTPWNALRHRKVYEWLNGHLPPVLITEAGMDAVENAKAGWKANGIAPLDYAQMLLDYEREIAQDDFVLGATVFTSGASSGDWTNFDVDEITYYLIEALAAQDDEPTAVERVLREWDAEHKEPNMDEATQNALIEMEARQNAELTGALVAILKGNLWDGAESVAGRVVALTGKSLDELGISPK